VVVDCGPLSQLGHLPMMCVCVCIAHINPTKGPSGMDYNMFKRLFTKYSYQVDAPEVKTFCAVRPKCPLAGVKKAVIQQENSIWGVAFCRDREQEQRHPLHKTERGREKGGLPRDNGWSCQLDHHVLASWGILVRGWEWERSGWS